MPKTYYNDPTQVKFWDADGYHWIGGVAYHDIIICGCCGCVFEITEILEEAPEDIAVPILELPWIDISEEIKAE